MAKIEKTIFISYRRADVYTALAVYENLKNEGYDVFFDYRSISSGDFEQIITANIKARAHFLLILTPTALDRLNEPGDWLRREIETAMDEKRNIIPLFFRGFRFDTPLILAKLNGKLKNLSRYNGLNVHEDYFDEAMLRLRIQYLTLPLDTVLHPISTEVQRVVKEEQVAADEALKHIDDKKEQPNEKSALKYVKKAPVDFAQDKSYFIAKLPKQQKVGEPPREKSKLVGEYQLKSSAAEKKSAGTHASMKVFPSRIIAGLVVGLVVIVLGIWGWASFPRYVSVTLDPNTNVVFTQSALTVQAYNTAQSGLTDMPLLLTETSTPPTPTPSIGSSMIGKDDMTLLYVPAGDFTMGGNAEDAFAECQKFASDCQLDWFIAEMPPHTVYLDDFWIDRTEVTNAMYAMCVNDGQCNSPGFTKSYTRENYYGNSQFDNYPVIYVSWNDANDYCSWIGRRLPTEGEWEKAARGPNGQTYPWGNEVPNKNLLNYDKGIGDTTEVGKYINGASPYGALDMAGNVWEWVNDWYNAYPGTNLNASPDFGEKYRVLRGGGWFDDNDAFIRSTYRARHNPDDNNYPDYGFRCAMDASP